MKLRALIPLLVSMPLASGAFAQPVDDAARGAARTLAEQGVAALQNGDSATAVDKLERAYQIVKLPAVGLWSARALVRANRWVNGAERYLEITRWKGTSAEAEVQEQAKAAAAKERDELLPRIPTLTIQIAGANPNDVMVSLDGSPVLAALIGSAQPVDPTHHVVRGTHGAQVVEQSFDGVEQQPSTVTLTFGASAPAGAPPQAGAASTAAAPPGATAPAPEAPADRGSSFGKQRIIGIAVGGAGVVAGAIGGVFLLNALSKKSDADKFCHSGACTSQEGVNLLSDARSAGNVATIGGIAGLVLVSAGVVLFVTAPSPSEKTSLVIGPAVQAGGGSVVASGSF